MQLTKNEIQTSFLLALSIVLGVFLIIKIRKAFLLSGLDDRSRKAVLSLDPKIQDQAIRFYYSAKRKNMPFTIVSGYRTFAQQASLYAQGRTMPGTIVTNAPAGYSWHNYGRAFDIYPKNVANWNALGKLGVSYGLEWGGNWTSFIDKPHFQNRFGLTIKEALNKKVDENGFIQ
ncbi:MAG TPA: peptidase M15 [Flavobacterium sp.]|nr:peptidase M15 [Flavobacterium sp.]